MPANHALKLLISARQQCQGYSNPFVLRLQRRQQPKHLQAPLANDYSFLGDQDAATAEVAEVEHVVALTPESADGYAPLSWALNSLGKPAEALVAVDTAIRSLLSRSCHPGIAPAHRSADPASRCR
jgi:hypothetical protein